jgi:uncharacterized membrane protein HdeD (DUF308 family)
MLVNGIFAITAAISERKTYRNWGWLMAFGLLGIAAGILTFLNPFATGTFVVYFVAAWAFMIGIAEIVWAVRLSKYIEGEGWFIVSGILSIVFSVAVFFFPAAGAITLALMFGIYALLIGILLVTLSFRLRSRRRRIIPIS